MIVTVRSLYKNGHFTLLTTTVNFLHYAHKLMKIYIVLKLRNPCTYLHMTWQFSYSLILAKVWTRIRFINDWGGSLPVRTDVIYIRGLLSLTQKLQATENKRVYLRGWVTKPFRNISLLVMREYRELYALMIVLIIAYHLFLQFQPLPKRAFAYSLMHFTEVA